MRYTIVSSDTHDKLSNHVQDMIDLGWEPQGGIAVTGSMSNGDLMFLQAMLKRPQDEELLLDDESIPFS